MAAFWLEVIILKSLSKFFLNENLLIVDNRSLYSQFCAYT